MKKLRGWSAWGHLIAWLLIGNLLCIGALLIGPLEDMPDEVLLTLNHDEAIEKSAYIVGYSDALDEIALLHLELVMRGESKTFGEMKHILCLRKWPIEKSKGETK